MEETTFVYVSIVGHYNFVYPNTEAGPQCVPTKYLRPYTGGAKVAPHQRLTPMLLVSDIGKVIVWRDNG